MFTLHKGVKSASYSSCVGSLYKNVHVHVYCLFLGNPICASSNFLTQENVVIKRWLARVGRPATDCIHTVLVQVLAVKWWESSIPQSAFPYNYCVPN